ncbi:hypothetical protein Plo01_10660 [Planobispora longispora]|uniref:Signal transduction histidine-protein kinase/phosphatase MprB n=1 Tax=Planobispora longispora TaxID=28887 RepID=A0A8J3RIU6_9ACTN|nr:hypothetical protein Plo01_10660 [Planobispora longispora]
MRPLDFLGRIKVKLGMVILLAVAAAFVVNEVGINAGFSRDVRVAVAAVLALIMVQLLARGMTKPLREMAAAAQTIAQGRYGLRVTATSRDEVGELARAFNAMAADLGEVDRQRRELVANVSHELRTPITALRAVLENVVDGVSEPDPATLGTALAQTERLGRLVAQLLDLSRLESGARLIDPENVELRALCEQALREAVLAREEVTARCEVPAGLSVRADADLLAQVLANLLDNAVRHSPAGGVVVLSADCEGPGVRLRVIDQGPGIPEEDRARAFERFSRLDAGRAADDGGAGLGLAITKEIVELHGGSIRVEDGVGCRIAVDLPERITMDTSSLPDPPGSPGSDPASSAFAGAVVPEAPEGSIPDAGAPAETPSGARARADTPADVSADVAAETPAAVSAAAPADGSAAVSPEVSAAVPAPAPGPAPPAGGDLPPSPESSESRSPGSSSPDPVLSGAPSVPDMSREPASSGASPESVPSPPGGFPVGLFPQSGTSPQAATPPAASVPAETFASARSGDRIKAAAPAPAEPVRSWWGAIAGFFIGGFIGLCVGVPVGFVIGSMEIRLGLMLGVLAPVVGAFIGTVVGATTPPNGMWTGYQQAGSRTAAPTTEAAYPAVPVLVGEVRQTAPGGGLPGGQGRQAVPGGDGIKEAAPDGAPRGITTDGYVAPSIFPRPELPDTPRWMLAVCAVVGVLAAVALPGSAAGLGVALVAVAMGAATLPVVRRRLTPWSIGMGVIAYGLVAVAVFRDADWLVGLLLLAGFLMAALALSGAGRGWLGVIRGAFSVVLGLLPLPWFLAAPVKGKGMTARRRLVPTLLGLGIAIVLLAVFGALFASADAVFAEAVERVFTSQNWADDLPLRIVVFAAFAVAVASAVLVVLRPVVEPKGPDVRLQVGRGLWVTPLVALNLLFGTFVAMQLTVLFGSARWLVTTTDLTYAEYARSGFFQLVIVSVFVLAIVAVASGALELQGRDRWLMAGLLGLLCALTVVILISAMYRLDLYVDAYGYTRLRASVGAAIWWLGGIFALVLVAGAVRLTGRAAGWLPRGVVVMTGAGLLAFAIWNPDLRVAESQLSVRGVDRLDQAYLSDLGAEAVPALDLLPEPTRSCVLREVIQINQLDGADPWNGWNLARERARELLAERPVPAAPSCASGRLDYIPDQD